MRSSSGYTQGGGTGSRPGTSERRASVTTNEIAGRRPTGTARASEATGGALGSAPRQAYMPRYSINPSAQQDQSNSAERDINMDILAKVKEKFDSADQDGTGHLSQEEFVAAFTGVLQTEDGGDALALGKLFMRIDANSDGTIDWDEFSTYMLLESQGSASVREFESAITLQQAPLQPCPENLMHKDAITHITALKLASGADRYVTCGKDGLVKLWNSKDLKHVRSISSGSSWATVAKYMPLTQKLLIGSFSRTLRIFDLSSFECCGQIPDMDHVPLSLDVWVPARRRDTELVAVGDGGGWVRLFEVTLNPLEDKNSTDRYLERCRWRHQHHTDWVTKVKYIDDMNCVVAASLDKTVSMTDAEERVPLKRLTGHHTKGINAIDWSPIYKFIVTGSQDRRIIMWNPFSQKPLAVLNGHNAAVNEVLVNDRDNQIISLAADHTVKLWDIRNHRCLQTLLDREAALAAGGMRLSSARRHGPNAVGSSAEEVLLPAYYDTTRRQLMTGHLRPKAWPLTTGASRSAAHTTPVVRALYNNNFEEAVSVDQGGTISVWYVPSGKLRYRFQNAHGTTRVSAMSFDSAKRRLITGAEDGEVKVWNFSSGAVLARMRNNDPAAVKAGQSEVTAVVPWRGALMKYILAAGWDRKITFYEDSGTSREVAPGRVIPGHKSDVLALCPLESSSSVATSSDDGEVVIWNMESGAPKRKLIAPGTDLRPANERAVEAIAFLQGPGTLRHVLVAVGADRWLRFWDVMDGHLLLQRFTGHAVGETVQALALDGRNTLIATGDSAGMIKVWDISAYTGGEASITSTTNNTSASSDGSTPPTSAAHTHHSPSHHQNHLNLHHQHQQHQQSSPMAPMSPSGGSGRVLEGAAAAAAVREVAVWRGASKHITSLDWVIGPHGTFLMSSGADCSLVLWDERGCRVGTYGVHSWVLHQRSTWQTQTPDPLSERDAWLMETSAMHTQYEAKVIAVAASGTHVAPGTPLTSQGYQQQPAATHTAAGVLQQASSSPRAHHQAAERAVSPMLMASPSSRPSTAPLEVQLVMEASNSQRLQSAASLRHRLHAQHSPARHTATPTSASSPAGAAACRPSLLSPHPALTLSGGLPSHLHGDDVAINEGGSPTAAAQQQQAEEKEQPWWMQAIQKEGLVSDTSDPEDGQRRYSDDSNSGIEESDDHDSDAEVPVALWLPEFDLARRVKLTTDAATDALTTARSRAMAAASAAQQQAAAGGPSSIHHKLPLAELAPVGLGIPGSGAGSVGQSHHQTVMSARRGVATAAGVISEQPTYLGRPGSRK